MIAVVAFLLVYIAGFIIVNVFMAAAADGRSAISSLLRGAGALLFVCGLLATAPTFLVVLVMTLYTGKLPPISEHGLMWFVLFTSAAGAFAGWTTVSVADDADTLREMRRTSPHSGLSVLTKDRRTTLFQIKFVSRFALAWLLFWPFASFALSFDTRNYYFYGFGDGEWSVILAQIFQPTVFISAATFCLSWIAIKIMGRSVT